MTTQQIERDYSKLIKDSYFPPIVSVSLFEKEARVRRLTYHYMTLTKFRKLRRQNNQELKEFKQSYKKYLSKKRKPSFSTKDTTKYFEKWIDYLELDSLDYLGLTPGELNPVQIFEKNYKDKTSKEDLKTVFNFIHVNWCELDLGGQGNWFVFKMIEHCSQGKISNPIKDAIRLYFIQQTRWFTELEE